jgi:hypothetical protein
MLDRLLVAFGVVELLFPERLIDYGEGLALENPDECELEPWVPAVARLEGLAFLWLVFRGRASLVTFRSLFGFNGLLAVLSPRGFLDYWTGVVYADHERCEWKPWVVPATRLIGVVYLALAFSGRRAARRRRAE